MQVLTTFRMQKTYKQKNRRFTNRNRASGKKKFQGEKISVDRLVHTARPLEEVNYTSKFSFDDLPFHPDLKRNISGLGFKSPTEIQEKAFEPIMQLKDVIGIASTGTGKTGAFLIPVVNGLLTEEFPFSTLVMVPTRELALQVEDEFKKLTRGLNLYITSVIGGQNILRDIKNLRRTNHVIVGTPGRLTDLVQRKVLFLEEFSALVLDEFDRMLDMGFSKDVNYLMEKMINRDQTLLFSATIDEKQRKMINQIMKEPVEIKVSSGNTTAEHINQSVLYEKGEEKLPKLLEMINNESFEKVLVFAETKRNVAKLTKALKNSGIKSDEIHGDKSQNYRQNALRSFKNGRIKVLVATDVAARGLDISNVTQVINYEMPQNYEKYIHRIGRTGRAGKGGNAYTFV